MFSGTAIIFICKYVYTFLKLIVIEAVRELNFNFECQLYFFINISNTPIKIEKRNTCHYFVCILGKCVSEATW